MTDLTFPLDPTIAAAIEKIRAPEFAGICIGGPLAGRSMAHMTNRVSFPDYRAVRELNAHPRPLAAGETSPYERHTYRFEKLHVSGSDKAICMWIFEPKTTLDALIEVFTCYELKQVSVR